MKKSLSQNLYEYLVRDGGLVHSAQLEDYARSLGFKSSNCGRCLREMYNTGKIEREYRLNDGVRVVWYRANPSYKPLQASRSDVFVDMGISSVPMIKQLKMTL